MTKRNKEYCDLRDRWKRWGKWLHFSSIVWIGSIIITALITSRSELLRPFIFEVLLSVALIGWLSCLILYFRKIGDVHFPRIECQKCGTLAAHSGGGFPYFHDKCWKCGNDNTILE